MCAGWQINFYYFYWAREEPHAWGIGGQRGAGRRGGKWGWETGRGKWGEKGTGRKAEVEGIRSTEVEEETAGWLAGKKPEGRWACEGWPEPGVCWLCSLCL